VLEELGKTITKTGYDILFIYILPEAEGSDVEDGVSYLVEKSIDNFIGRKFRVQFNGMELTMMEAYVGSSAILRHFLYSIYSVA
jgi:hypothetical protein